MKNDIEMLRDVYKTVRREFLEKHGKISGLDTKEKFDAATKGATPMEWTMNALAKIDFWNERVADWNSDWDVE